MQILIEIRKKNCEFSFAMLQIMLLFQLYIKKSAMIYILTMFFKHNYIIWLVVVFVIIICNAFFLYNIIIYFYTI
jgi:hypothetical protein